MYDEVGKNGGENDGGSEENGNFVGRSNSERISEGKLVQIMMETVGLFFCIMQKPKMK